MPSASALAPVPLPVQLAKGGLASAQPLGVAESTALALSGTRGPVPHRAAMEQSFGRDFGCVEAHTGPAAAAGCAGLGAEALASGQSVAFREASPSPAVVAHELTHVLESSRETRGKDGDPAEIDRAHEGTAEAVEGAVRQGRSASSVIDERGLGGGGEGVQLFSSSMTLSGAQGIPCSLGVNDRGEILASRTEFPLWPRTVIPTPPLYPGLFFQIFTQGGLQTTGTVGPDATSFGARFQADLNLELAGGIPVASLSGGVGMRAVSDIRLVATSDSLSIQAGAMSFRGALIVAANAGPNAVLRLEWRMVEAEIIRFLWGSIGSNGIEGGVFQWGEDVQRLVDFVNELVGIVARIGDAITEPIQRVVIQAGESIGSVLSGIAEVASALGCMADGVGLAIGEAISGPAYDALWDECLAMAMLGGTTEPGPAARGDADRDFAVGSILGTLWSEFCSDRPDRRGGEPIDLADLLSWHQRVESTAVGSLPDVASGLGMLGLDARALGALTLINFMWELERARMVRFRGDPNDAADRIAGPIIAGGQDGMAEARAQQAQQCGP